MGDAGRQNAGFAGSGAGQDQQGAAGVRDGLPLLGIQPVEMAVGATARLAGTGSAGAGSSVISNGSAGGAMDRHIAIGAADAYL